jgi:hypothetical protein
MQDQATLQSDFVIGILSGALTLASLSLAIFGFLFSTFAQLMGQIGFQEPPKAACRLRQVAWWTLVLTGISSLIAILCIIWLCIQKGILLLFISGSVILLLLLICSLIFYVIRYMMILR